MISKFLSTKLNEDLNRIFPGRYDGDESEVYSYRIMNSIVSTFGYHIDLHTASFGRINSYYVRADMSNPTTQRMAQLQNAVQQRILRTVRLSPYLLT